MIHKTNCPVLDPTYGVPPPWEADGCTCPIPEKKEEVSKCCGAKIHECQWQGAGRYACDKCDKFCIHSLPKPEDNEIKHEDLFRHRNRLCDCYKDTQKKESWEEEFDKKFGILEQVSGDGVDGTFALETDREKVKSFIHTILEQRDKFWQDQEMGKSDDCFKHCEEARQKVVEGILQRIRNSKTGEELIDSQYNLGLAEAECGVINYAKSNSISIKK